MEQRAYHQRKLWLPFLMAVSRSIHLLEVLRPDGFECVLLRRGVFQRFDLTRGADTDSQAPLEAKNVDGCPPVGFCFYCQAGNGANLAAQL